MDEGRKRVLAIVAGILVVRHLKTPEHLGVSRPSPRTEYLISSAVQYFAEERVTMTASLEETQISVWRQALVHDSKTVTLEGGSYLVRRTSRSKLREVDFQFEGQRLRGLEQNPKTSSRWAQLAREGKKVMQFLSDRRYIANVVDGKVQFYWRGGNRGLNGSERK